MPERPPVRAPLTRVATVLAWLAMVVSLRASAQPVTVDFDIPAGPLADALDELGAQTGLQIVYDYSSVEERRVPALSGTMQPGEALDRFLADSGLTWRFVNERTVVLQPAKAPRAARRKGSRGRPAAVDEQGQVLTALTVIGNRPRAVPMSFTGASGLEKSALATPRSVALVSEDAIDDLGLSAVEDLVRAVPSVYTTTRWGIQGSIDIRNVPADTYFRGMKRLSLQGHGRSVLTAMERIEVVKGPPSPIYGMGKIGGYTNMVPRSIRAANGSYLSAPQGFVQAVSGSYGKAEMSFGVGGPLRLDTKPGGYYVYGLVEDSDTFIEQVPVGQRLLQAGVSIDDAIGGFRLEAGVNLQRSATVGALLGRFTQDVASSGRYLSGEPLVDLDVNGNGRIGYLEMYAASPVRGEISAFNQALRQVFAWPRRADGSPMTLDEVTPVPGIPQSLYDYLIAHPEADPSGLLRGAGPGGPAPISGYVPAGFALDPRTVRYEQLDMRRAGAVERELQADFVTAYLDFVNDADPRLTVKNQLFFDGMDQHKLSEQPFSQEQDVYVVEDKLTVTRRFAPRHDGTELAALVTANVRYTSSAGRMALGDYGSHRSDAMRPGASLDPVFATPLLNPDLEDDGSPWQSHYASEAWEVGVGALLDMQMPTGTNVMLGARLDWSRATNVDYAGTLDLTAGTATSPAVFRAADERASGRDTGTSWSVSVSHPLANGVSPYFTIAQSSLALDENNNKYANEVIEAGHIGSARLVEAGVKAALLDERMYFAAAVYEQSRNDVSEDSPQAVLDAHVTATATRGLEAELRWEATEKLLLSFYGLRQKTRYTPNVGASILVDARAIGFADIVDAAGNVVYPAEAFFYGGRAFIALPPGMPQYEVKQGNPSSQIGAAAVYRPSDRIGVTFSANYFSSVYSGRLRLVELPAAYVLNAGVSWSAPRWQVRLDLLNALDERYFRARSGDTLGDSLVSAMPGRRWLVTLRTRF